MTEPANPHAAWSILAWCITVAALAAITGVAKAALGADDLYLAEVDHCIAQEAVQGRIEASAECWADKQERAAQLLDTLAERRPGVAVITASERDAVAALVRVWSIW